MKFILVSQDSDDSYSANAICQFTCHKNFRDHAITRDSLMQVKIFNENRQFKEIDIFLIMATKIRWDTFIKEKSVSWRIILKAQTQKKGQNYTICSILLQLSAIETRWISLLVAVTLRFQILRWCYIPWLASLLFWGPALVGSGDSPGRLQALGGSRRGGMALGLFEWHPSRHLQWIKRRSCIIRLTLGVWSTSHNATKQCDQLLAGQQFSYPRLC